MFSENMTTRKGISMPIEMIVVIAIAVLVLVVVAALFTGGTKPIGSMSHEVAFGQGCVLLRINYNCNPTILTSAIAVPNYRPAGEVVDNSLAVACINTGHWKPGSNSVTDPDGENLCRIGCGCPPLTT